MDNYSINEKTSALIDKIKEKFPIGEKKSAIIESLLLLQHENKGHITKNMMQF